MSASPPSAGTAYVIRRRLGEQPLFRHATPVLEHLDIELTERCNNDCVHCFIRLPQNDEVARRREMTTTEVEAVLTEAAALGALSVRFTGGEPLLREDFEELYVFARRLGLRVVLFTNARLLTPEVVELLARIPPLGLIEVSAYGMSAASYETVTRRRGAYAEFRRGVELLRERAIGFVVKGALLPGLAHEINQFETWAATLPAMNGPPSFSVFFDLRGRRDSEQRNEIIRALRLSPEEGVRFLARDRGRYVAEMRQFCSKFMCPSGAELFSCGAGHGACIDAYGVVQPCLLLRHPDTVVNLRAGSDGGSAAFDATGLRHALSDVFPRLRQIRATNPAYLSRCARCFLKGLCEQCPARSWAENGTLDTPVEYLCNVAHTQAYDLGLLDAGERAWQLDDWGERVKRI